ncbi:MAG: ATP-binding protein [Anaerolineae bacterium]
MMTQNNASCVAELRHVAVLFADLQGFTRLCERLDPEEVVEILDVIYERLGVEFGRYGGQLDKVLGDGLMVLFGAPQAHEDDGLRSILAGLAMQKAMAELQPWVQERLGQGLGMRIGIDAGPVVYGKVGPGMGAVPTVIGDAANVAARLQRVAAPGQVLISERARRLASRQIQFRKLGTVQLEGRAAAVEAYVAVAPFAPLTGPQSGVLVGRSAEAKRLMAIFSAAATGRAALVLLTGEAGIGKSRLLTEFANSLQTLDAKLQPMVIHIRNRWEVGATYRPSENLVNALLTRSRVNSGEDGGKPGSASGRTPIVGLLFSASDEKAAATALADICKRQPLVILIDDWQWAEASDKQRFVSIIREIAGQRVLLVISGRRVDLPEEPSWPDVSINRLRLAPLPAKESWLLLQQHPAFSALPWEAAESLLERAGGNPAHVLDSMESLIEQGHLAPSGDGWRVKASDVAPQVPETMRNDIISRLDALDPENRYLLRVCAVIGSKFSIPLLAEATKMDESIIKQGLFALIEAGLVVTGAPSEESYVFRSELVRQVTYDTMLKRQRRELHQLIGTVLENWGGVTDEELAPHFVLAGQAEKAVTYGLAASRAMLARGEAKEALQILNEMEQFIATDDVERRATFLELLGDAYITNGNCSEGLDRFLQALALVRDPSWRGRLMVGLGWAYAMQGRTEMAAKHYRRAQEIVATIGDQPQQTMIAAAMRLLYDRP